MAIEIQTEDRNIPIDPDTLPELSHGATLVCQATVDANHNDPLEGTSLPLVRHSTPVSSQRKRKRPEEPVKELCSKVISYIDKRDADKTQRTKLFGEAVADIRKCAQEMSSTSDNPNTVACRRVHDAAAIMKVTTLLGNLLQINALADDPNEIETLGHLVEAVASVASPKF